MRIKKVLMLCITGLFILQFTYLLEAQTSSTGSRISTSGGSRTTDRTSFREDEDKEKRMGSIRELSRTMIGTMLRHPDAKIRMQAVQAITMGMIGTEESGGSDEEGLRSFFAISKEEGGDEEGLSTGLGGSIFIPDLYMLLNDPDPEIRDFASVTLDMLFKTDNTLFRFTTDSDPLVRKYATEILSKKRIAYSQERGGGREEELAEVRDLLTLRTLLVQLKYEKDPAVRKSVEDTINWYIKYGGEENRGGRGEGANILGTNVAFVTDYLNDPDPEIRKQAVKTIAARDFTDETMMKLMERLRVEKDDEVRNEIISAIENIRARQTYDREGRTGGGGAAGIIP